MVRLPGTVTSGDRLGTGEDMLFFIHIPKTAGTSLREVMKSPLGDRLVPVYPGQPDFNPANVFSRDHPPNAVLFGHFHWGIHKGFGAGERYATTLRDPVKRVISWYKFVRSDPSHAFYKSANCESLAAMIRSNHHELNNLMTACISGGTDLKTAKKRLQRFAFVGTDLTLRSDVYRLSHLLGVTLPPLPHTNQSPSAPITEEDMEVARQHNQLDIELYQFATEIAAEQQSQHIVELHVIIKAAHAELRTLHTPSPRGGLATALMHRFTKRK